MKKLLLLVLLSTPAFAVTGFLTGEKQSGMAKICYYDVMGDTHAITIKAVELCPLTWEFNI